MAVPAGVTVYTRQTYEGVNFPINVLPKMKRRNAMLLRGDATKEQA